MRRHFGAEQLRHQAEALGLGFRVARGGGEAALRAGALDQRAEIRQKLVALHAGFEHLRAHRFVADGAAGLDHVLDALRLEADERLGRILGRRLLRGDLGGLDRHRRRGRGGCGGGSGFGSLCNDRCGHWHRFRRHARDRNVRQRQIHRHRRRRARIHRLGHLQLVRRPRHLEDGGALRQRYELRSADEWIRSRRRDQAADQLRVRRHMLVEQPLADALANLFRRAQLSDALHVVQIVRAGSLNGHVAVARPDAIGLVLLIAARAVELDDRHVAFELRVARAVARALRGELIGAIDLDESARVGAIHRHVIVKCVALPSGRRRHGGAGQRLGEHDSGARRREQDCGENRAHDGAMPAAIIAFNVCVPRS